MNEQLTYSEHLKLLVKNAEDRIVDWKLQLADYNKHRMDMEWFKDMLRECKNADEKSLKDLREELTYFNQGLNPPFCYPVYMRNKQ